MKPTYERPQLYAQIFMILKKIAKDHGYNLVVHGSMNRDLDLIAIPWVNDPKPEFDMINALNKAMTGKTSISKEHFLHRQLPGGRNSYVINLDRGGYRKNEAGEIVDPLEYTPDPQYYIDISVTPLVVRDQDIAPDTKTL